MKRKMRTAIIGIFTAAFASYANAGDLSGLKKGIYLPKDVGCDGIGGAAQLYFDGTNISGHYQICKTVKLKQNNKYRSTCLEAQGSDQPTLADIDKSKNREIFDLDIDVKSNKSFVSGGSTYNYCGDG